MRVASINICELRGLVSKPSRIDPERLAALMEGKLSASEAAEVRAELAASDPEAIEAFADAATVGAELGLMPKDAPRTDEGRSLPFRFIVLGLAAAAVVAFVALKLRGRQGSDFSASQMLAQLPSTIAAPASDPWPARRGEVENLPASVRAARLGVMLVDFELATRTGDTTTVRRSSARIAELADGIPGAGSLVAFYRLVGSGRGLSGSNASKDTVNQALAKLAGQQWVRAGAAAEALRALAMSADSATIASVCVGDSALKQALAGPIAPLDAASRDSLLKSLAENPCPADRIRAFSSEFLSRATP